MPDCDHDGQLVELPELRMVRCDACGEVSDTVERHFREVADA